MTEFDGRVAGAGRLGAVPLSASEPTHDPKAGVRHMPVSAEPALSAMALSDGAEHAVWQWSPHQFVDSGLRLCLLCGADARRAIHDRKWAISGGLGFIANVPHGPDSSS